jgi:hypothetical protein
MTMPSAIRISTSLSGSALEDAVDEIINEFSFNIDDKLIWFYGGDNGSGFIADADLCALMEGHTPESGAWSDCFCPDLEIARGTFPQCFASNMKGLVHIKGNTIIIEEQTETYGFQEQYDFLYKKLSVLKSN